MEILRVQDSAKAVTNKALNIWNEYLWPSFSTVLFARPLHFALTRFVADIKPGDKTLELCSGYPWYELYADLGGKDGLFVALDINQSIQKRSKYIGNLVDKYIRGKNASTVKHLVASAYDTLPFKANTFDNLLINQSHLPTEEAFRVLKPGGRVLVSYAEGFTFPVSSASEYMALRKSRFKDVKIFPGTPSTAAYVLGHTYLTGTFNPTGAAVSGLNWYVSATKPISKRNSPRSRR